VVALPLVEVGGAAVVGAAVVLASLAALIGDFPPPPHPDRGMIPKASATTPMRRRPAQIESIAGY
jgi:hypothetical protein